MAIQETEQSLFVAQDKVLFSDENDWNQTADWTCTNQVTLNITVCLDLSSFRMKKYTYHFRLQFYVYSFPGYRAGVPVQITDAICSTIALKMNLHNVLDFPDHLESEKGVNFMQKPFNNRLRVLQWMF